MRAFVAARTYEMGGFALGLAGLLLVAVQATYTRGDPSWNSVPAGDVAIGNLFGRPGAVLADVMVQGLGFGGYVLAFLPLAWGWRLSLHKPVRHPLLRLQAGVVGIAMAAVALAGMTTGEEDPLSPNPGGSVGRLLLEGLNAGLFDGGARSLVATGATAAAGLFLFLAIGVSPRDWVTSLRDTAAGIGNARRGIQDGIARLAGLATGGVGRLAGLAGGLMPQRREAPETVAERRDPSLDRGTDPVFDSGPVFDDELAPVTRKAPPAPAAAGDGPRRSVSVVAPPQPAKPKAEQGRPSAPPLIPDGEGIELPPVDLLQAPSPTARAERLDEDSLRRNAEVLEGVLSDFGVRGEVQKVHPGPVVTLYELEPAPGTKSSRVIGLADDIARSMSAVSVRVAVVPGRNVIGIELPNAKRETVLLRELLSSDSFGKSQGKLALALGKDIGGQPVVADLARFPHLLVAGTTGSGKSVAVNTMILSLLYRLPPDRCRFIMIDPKMLELSVYEGIPHLLAPVVTDPKKAVVALKWTVREMEDRYRNMSKLGVRNIEGYNARLREAREEGELLTRKVQTGFDPDTGKPLFEEQPLDLIELPYIVVIVDEMADLMLVAGKDIEAAIQRLAQMARAAGIHLIMATQRPSVDVITGTIKANFPTRISFQVTSKIDSRTILGEQGAEQLLGQGDMLYMAGGGRITRVHGPFVSDGEVEQVVRFLKAQGEPSYVDAITEEDEDAEGGSYDDGGSGGASGSGDELYDKAVAVVCRERKASTSFIQRQLRIGYNSAARLIERMELEGVVSKPNHSGKREVLARNIEE
ncbi:cell division protein FtsK [Azospirillum sp. RWY-5-1]|uniref:DNA translocase FtsK n=2 Tax=Azospirillum oleiclasticum TaxID=2735135 RepID=A0ABX2TH98_9PROT|nr:cell division protein FtsK [Azospirillum oleiclasticum]NYZ23544.1 cell division protein FtsK [Azospirillum oleiclasticum]